MVALSDLMVHSPLFPEYVGTCRFWFALLPFFLPVLAPWFSFGESTSMSSSVHVVPEGLTQQLGSRARHLALASAGGTSARSIPFLFSFQRSDCLRDGRLPQFEPIRVSPGTVAGTLGKKAFFVSGKVNFLNC